MIEFSIENLLDVNIAMANGAVVYMINGEPVSVQDFTAIMLATQLLFTIDAAPDDDEEEEPGGGGQELAYDPPFGG